MAQSVSILSRHSHHPPERMGTHCMLLEVESNVLHVDKERDYFIRNLKADVGPVPELQASFPQLTEILGGPNDLTRIRYVIILKNHFGEMRRARCCQWNDPSTLIQRVRQGMMQST
ncbi:hypothetical protein BC835DRAFT_1415953 [Cytidiella melzeri]|nr:hypothetical protein BC835DRAFT_1415953 [Cytidiella melzeri]